MKLNIKSFLIALVISLAACSEDSMIDPLIGSWTLTNDVYEMCLDPDLNESDIYNCNTYCQKLIFKNDNKIESIEIEYSNNESYYGTYQKLSDDKIRLCFDNDCDTYNYLLEVEKSDTVGRPVRYYLNLSYETFCKVTEYYVKDLK